MSSLFGTVADSVADRVKAAIESALLGAEVEVVTRAPGHLSIRVVSDAFEGKSLVNKQRLVYRAIAPLMSGPDAPVHAIDQLETVVPG
ncbi:MAG: BolA family transcriptional regulator [Proteobacteria bacterium]|nr:MAG: BolA family transcriptional regulator [Pseudomonadota bacterium]